MSSSPPTLPPPPHQFIASARNPQALLALQQRAGAELATLNFAGSTSARSRTPWRGTMSHGALAGDIPGLQIGATRVAQAIARDLFVEDADAHWARLQAHEEPELLNTRWYVPPSAR